MKVYKTNIVLLFVAMVASSHALAQETPYGTYRPHNPYSKDGPSEPFSPSGRSATNQVYEPPAWKRPDQLSKTPEDANDRYRNLDGTYGEKRNATIDLQRKNISGGRL